MTDHTYWIALNQVKGIGIAHLRDIYRVLDGPGLSAVDLFDLTEEEIRQEFALPDRVVKGIMEAHLHLEKVEETRSTLLEAGIEVIPFFSTAYPPLLMDIMGHHAPPFFYTLGEVSLLSRPGVALLGDMNISSRGEANAFMAARELTRHDITVLGGMSRGAGIAAHRSALENRGTTVALLPMGILNLNIPPVLQEVYDPERILIASPFFPDLDADKYRAYNRNRLICALSRAVYIIEAPEEGGIFEAAKSARELNVPLYTTEYSHYPDGASGNRRILEEMGGKPVRGRMVNNMLTPNLDSLIADVKFGS